MEANARGASLPQVDFDHYDPTFAADPFGTYHALLAQGGIAYSERHGGFWLPTRYDDLLAIVHDTSHFSSAKASIPDTPFADQGVPPLTTDPPEHAKYRRLLLPAFSPQAIDRWEVEICAFANQLIDTFILQHGCDAATEYAAHIPAAAICLIVGVPTADAELFLRFMHHLLNLQSLSDGSHYQELMGMFAYLQGLIQAHREAPQDDLITALLDSSVDGKPLEDLDIIKLVLLLVAAGIDTTWHSLGTSLWYLAQHRDEQARLRDDPDLIPTAVEELLRAFAPVTMARVVTEDVEFRGCPMKAGDRVLLPFPAGSRDPQAFPDPDRVILDRPFNRHLAFGGGIHRCIGSNLARMELRVGIREFLVRIPEFRLADPDAVTWEPGPVRGPVTLPLVFD